MGFLADVQKFYKLGKHNTVAPSDTATDPAGVAAAVGVLPPGAVGLDSRTGYVTGWKSMPGFQNPSQQIGMFDGQLLNQYPAMLPGVQLHQGREFGNPFWYTPTQTYVPNGTVQLTQKKGQVPGASRNGSTYQGPIGPVSARTYKAAVTQAQAAQSGLANLAFASNLNLL